MKDRVVPIANVEHFVGRPVAGGIGRACAHGGSPAGREP